MLDDVVVTVAALLMCSCSQNPEYLSAVDIHLHMVF